MPRVASIFCPPFRVRAMSGLEPAALERMLAALRDAATGHYVVLLDLGAELDRAVRHLSAFADTLPEPTSLTDAYAVLKLHQADRPGGGAGVVVHQAASCATGERTHATLARACLTSLGRAPPLLSVVRRDERVRDAIRHQTPLLSRHPNCTAAADVEGIAHGLRDA
jgi:flagellar biosynthesis protein FlhG